MPEKVPPKYADPFLHCRTFGHTWRIGDRRPEGSAFFGFTLLCSVCKARRIDVINRRTGGVASRRYEYQEGYQADKSEGLRRTTYRIEFIRRING
jgi:hypothetical protein